MSQQIATARPDQPAPDPPTALEGLGRGWLILRNCRLGCPQGRGLPSALIHPAVGVALLDILPSESPGAVEAFRARLAAARFQAIFPGHLPVVHLRLSPRELDGLRTRLEHAFAGQPPLSLPGGDAWITAVARALTTEPAVPRLRSRRIRHHHRRGSFFRRLAGVAALATGVLAAVYVATGSQRSHAPAAEAPSAESPPVSGPDSVLMPVPQDIAAPSLTPPPEATAARDPIIGEAATAYVAPDPEVAPQSPAPPGIQEKQEAAAPQTPKPPTPERPSVDHTLRAAGLAATGSRASVLSPRSTSITRNSDPEFPRPEKESPPGKAAALHSTPPHEALASTRLPPIAERVLPPIAGPAAAHPLEQPVQRCHRIVYLVGQGVLLPDEDLQFFRQACVRR